MKGWWNDKCSTASWKEKESLLMVSAMAPQQHLCSSHGTIPRCLGFHSLLRWWNILGSRFQLWDHLCMCTWTTCPHTHWRRFCWNVVSIFSFLLFFQKRMWERRGARKKDQPRDGLQDQVIFNPTISETEHWAMNAISDEPVREQLHALTSHSSQTQTKRPNNYRYHWILYNIDSQFIQRFSLRFFFHTTWLSKMDAIEQRRY